MSNKIQKGGDGLFFLAAFVIIPLAMFIVLAIMIKMNKYWKEKRKEEKRTIKVTRLSAIQEGFLIGFTIIVVVSTLIIVIRGYLESFNKL